MSLECALDCDENSNTNARTQVHNEDDVLHLRVLPNFNKRLSARDSELLISYLTVPYLRIPLLLRFFSTPERIGALADPFLQEVLDAAMFEPSLWQHKLKKDCPEDVPAQDREHLATPCGLLLNELVKSPQVRGCFSSYE